MRARDLASGEERWLTYPIQRDDMESRATLDLLPGYAFTPDGAALVISYGGRLWRVPMDGSDPVEIPFEVDVTIHAGPRLDFDYPVEDSPTFPVRQIRDVALSPDGSEVAFTALGRLYVMEADGGTPREVGADVEAALFNPVWSPDGETLAAVSWQEPDWRASAHDFGGQRPRAPGFGRAALPAVAGMVARWGTDCGSAGSGERARVGAGRQSNGYRLVPGRRRRRHGGRRVAGPLAAPLPHG